MYKFAVLFALVAFVTAAPEPNPGYLAAAPVVLTQSVPLATSYSNSYKETIKTPVVHHAAYVAPAVQVAPVFAAQPLTYAAPVYSVHQAPLAYAHPALSIHPSK